MNFENLYPALDQVFAEVRAEFQNEQEGENQQRYDAIFALFPQDAQPFVEEALYYHAGEIVKDGLSAEEFCKYVLSFVEITNQQNERDIADKEMFDGVMELLDLGEVKSANAVAVLKANSEDGYASLLMRFIRLQQLSSPLDAAVSFLAWHHAKSLFDLEEEFGVDLSALRTIDDASCFGTSESQMALCSFSVSQS